jgi:ABC-type phosphate transport system substrate-binding protein
MNKLIFAVSLLIASFAGVSAGEMAVIVPVASPVQKMEKSEVAKIFLKKAKKWDDGTKVKSIDVKSGVRDAFLKSVLSMSSEELDRYWIELQYQGGQGPAIQVDGDAGGVEKVAGTPGGIAAVDAAAAKSNAGVRIVCTIPF